MSDPFALLEAQLNDLDADLTDFELPSQDEFMFPSQQQASPLSIWQTKAQEAEAQASKAKRENEKLEAKLNRLVEAIKEERIIQHKVCGILFCIVISKKELYFVVTTTTTTTTTTTAHKQYSSDATAKTNNKNT